MARVVILGAGISGHTAALHLRRMLPRTHEVVVVSPNANWNWIPSNIWVGVGRMATQDVVFPLAPVYRRKGITHVQAKAVEVRPEGDRTEGGDLGACVDVVHTSPDRAGETERITYDYLVNATGPRLNFAATPGLGPDAGGSLSVCTPSHAEHANTELQAVIATLQAGQRQRLVVGMGHGMCTCEGAAFEYVFNVEHELRLAGVRDLAEVVYLTNEYELGDFGVGGMTFAQQGFVTTSRTWTESLFRERGVRAILRAHVERVEPGKIFYETLDGEHHTLEADFAMLLPPFRGADLKAFDADGADISETLFAPSGFTKVDADYTPKPYDRWSAADWPSTYVTAFPNVFAVGIAFAPPHAISQPRKSPNGTVIAPAPPRTGMPSGVMGRVVAQTIADQIKKGTGTPAHTASMASMGAACIASAGAGLRTGTAAAMTMYPVVPDTQRFPDGGGRNLADTYGEIGLGAHWIKHMLHYLFLYKAKARPFWYLLPE